MNKSERLFALLTLLRARRYAVTARVLSEAMDVSERTIYRDIQSLQLSGVPITGEAGIGYLLDKRAHLPPLMFTEEETMALEVGMKMVRAWSDKGLAKAGQSASAKIQSVLPDHLKRQLDQIPVLVPDFHIESDFAAASETIRNAVSSHQIIYFDYLSGEGVATKRCVQPLGQVFWGKVWTLVAWCELRDDYRSFRVDRISGLVVTDRKFELSDEKSLRHYLQRYRTFS
ncbi:DNA-binding transcriptional regulator [Veronia nyctiphanis]|uniref:DNA-binding transcriptional regulator n=1 Tax=Veronia nyctiphanis TaxID=1278244 RepID=A0A4Q0YVQ9_9GAMM|nr:YafY family protein [Veronia nyctiphanis]RXJ74895.1 DNA-binding transcriptional regulator [Veronia nyctiphanis]